MPRLIQLAPWAFSAALAAPLFSSACSDPSEPESEDGGTAGDAGATAQGGTSGESAGVAGSAGADSGPEGGERGAAGAGGGGGEGKIGGASGEGGDGATEDGWQLGDEVSAMASPDEETTIATSDRVTLTIPAGALEEPTEITLRSLVFPQDDDTLDVFAGVELLPSGLEFSEAATLTLPLARALEPGSELRLASDPDGLTAFGDTGTLFAVDGSGTRASGPIYGFSGKVVMKNCHAGTRDNLLSAWDPVFARDRGSITADTGLSLDTLETCQLEADPLQTLLAQYFEPCGEAASDAPLSEDALASIAATIDAGRQVVMLFGSSIGGSGFSRTGVAHSAVVTRSGGELVIRNQIFVTNRQRLRDLEAAGGTTTVDLPLAELDQDGGMRDVRAGEAYTTYVLGSTLQNRDARARVWSHVVALCEKERPPVGDRDGDGTRDQDDNCPDDANPDQIDSDGDGEGNECDDTACPDYEVVTDACGGPNGCIEGFYCSTETIACEQETCPENAGRTYTLECCCDCWDDQTYRGVYDPCRAGFLLRCAPREP